MVDTSCSVIVMVDNGHNSGRSIMLLVTVVYSFKKFKNLPGGVYIHTQKEKENVKNQKYIFALFQLFKFLIYNFICIHFISFVNHTHRPSLFCLFVNIHTHNTISYYLGGISILP